MSFCLFGFLTAAESKPPVSVSAPDFTSEIRPLLSNHCFSCHGPDDKSRKGRFRLDLHDSAVGKGKSGEVIIVPGKPDESELIKRIFAHDDDELMPPPEAKKPLSETEKELLTRWVATGATYQPHWAFQPPVKTSLPEVRRTDWPANEIDRFVIARLEKEGLSPAAEADRVTLIRRVSLDLVGLPPTPDEVDAFITDQSSDSYIKLVDRLLASPHYGERWARKWLDLARYADTNGYEKDNPRSIWPWRDWVIDALNADLPFDQFTIKQIAGDLLPQASQQDRIATGFHRNTMVNQEGGIDPLEYRFHALTDRVATTGKTWLGLTVGCAQCHTHKFDPLPHREYYQFLALMNNADEPELLIKPDDFTQRQAAVIANVDAIVATLPAKYPIDTHRWATIDKSTFTSANGEQAVIQADGSWLLHGPGSDQDDLSVTMDTSARRVSVIKIETMPDGDLAAGRAANGNFVINELRVEASLGLADSPLAFTPVKLATAVADYSQKDYGVSGAIDGDLKTGWAVDGSSPKTPHQATVTLAEPLVCPNGVRLRVTLVQQFGAHHTLRHFRLRCGVDEPQANIVSAHIAAADQAFSVWCVDTAKILVHWRPLTPVSATSAAPTLTIMPDGSVLVSGDQTKNDLYQLTYRDDLAGITALRLEALPDESLPGGGPGRVAYEGELGDFLLNEFTGAIDGAPVMFSRAGHSFANGENTADKAIDGKADTGWSTHDQPGRAHAAFFVFDKPLISGRELAVKLASERYYPSALGRFRISVTSDPPPVMISEVPHDVAQILLIPLGQRTPLQHAHLKQYWLLSTPELQEARRDIELQRASLRAYPTSLVLQERQPGQGRITHLHLRGDYLQQAEEVQPGTFSILNPFPQDAPRNRLGLARWLVARDHPLTARVTVNRQWATFFGRGLVRTVDDFGYQGEAPSHLALLDWLAVTFMEDGWSLKRLHRRIVLSATYRQASHITPALLARDPHNVLLARGPRFRLDAEIIRDSLLSVSGLLSQKIGGPSVFPPQPDSVSNEGAFARFEWRVSSGEDRYRRGLYTFMKRTTPYAMSGAFDAPTGESCVAQREVSNSPLQALMMLNDPVVIECAQALGVKATQAAGDDVTRVSFLVRRCLGRLPSAPESRRLIIFTEQQRLRLSINDEASAQIAKPDPQISRELTRERAVWTLVARALMNTDEFLSKE